MNSQARNVLRGKLHGECLEKRPGVENVWIHMQDYKSLHEMVMICATLVNTQTHRETDSS